MKARGSIVIAAQMLLRSTGAARSEQVLADRMRGGMASACGRCRRLVGARLKCLRVYGRWHAGDVRPENDRIEWT